MSMHDDPTEGDHSAEDWLEQGEVIDELVEAHGGRSRMSLIRAVAVGLLAGVLLVAFVAKNPLGIEALSPVSSWFGGGVPAPNSADGGEAQLYSCGMHPTVIQDGPGTCPICEMDLTPMAMESAADSVPAASATAASGATEDIYTCPMHSMIERPDPGECPICGMDLELKLTSQTRPAGPGESATTRPQSQPTGSSSDQGVQTEGLWTCSMHPQVMQEAPGNCPICGMTLVPMDASPSEPEGERTLLFYRNPMNPMVTSPVPMQDEMGMDYVAVYSGAVGSGGATVTIDAGTSQLMNVVIATVERGDISRAIRTVGYLEYDEERMVSVTTKYAGFVEKVYANYLGQEVRKGDALFDVYAPELVQTQEELISALGYVRALEGASPEALGRASALVEAARRRLGYWDVSSEQIRLIEESGQPLRRLTVAAPSSGLIMKRMAGLEGMAIKPGMQVLHIADLSTLWLRAEIYEDQLAWMVPGDIASVDFSYFPSETFKGRVRFIDPEVKQKTRTVSVRLEIPNVDGRLRAGMYATVNFTPLTRSGVVTVPSEAVLRTGKRELVVVERGHGKFAPRDVTLGASGGGRVEVLAGLQEGERVVTSSQFLIDSESSLREVILKMLAARKKD